MGGICLKGSTSGLATPMFIPRRVRRRLLLPPGWVALGFLLLLGCWQIKFWKRQLLPIYMLQLTLPALKPKSEDVRNFSEAYKTTAQLNSFRLWRDVKFEGNSLSDFLNAANTESAIRQIIADTSHNGGVRVRFLPGATYANLVSVLDIMRYTDQKKYWLDIRYQCITLYAITISREDIVNHSLPFQLGCCTCGPYPTKPELKAAWYLKFQDLWSKPWRPTTVLVALIGMLSVWPLLCSRKHLRS